MHTNHHPGGTPTTNTNTQPHRRPVNISPSADLRFVCVG